MFIYIYIYIERERERCRYRYRSKVGQCVPSLVDLFAGTYYPTYLPPNTVSHLLYMSIH